MWRNEVGCYEMLSAFFDEHKEDMRPGRSRRDFLLEILHSYEMTKFSYGEEDDIMLPYNTDQSQPFYVLDRSMPISYPGMSAEPPPLFRPRGHWPFRQHPSWNHLRPPVQNVIPKAPPADNRIPVDVDEDSGSVTGVFPHEVPSAILGAGINDVTGGGESDQLRLPISSPELRKNGATKRKKKPRAIRRLALGSQEIVTPSQPGRARRQHLPAVNYSLAKRRGGMKAGGDASGPKRSGAPTVAGKRRGRRRKRKQKGRPTAQQVEEARPESVGSCVALKQEVLDETLSSSVRKCSRLVGHQNPILQRMKKKRQREEEQGVLENSESGASILPSAFGFSCNVCQRKFKHKGHLRNHRRHHKNKTKRFQCQICYKHFASKYYCAAHERMHMTGSPPPQDATNQNSMRENLAESSGAHIAQM